jgi:excisionase family DNA binding protein
MSPPRGEQSEGPVVPVAMSVETAAWAAGLSRVTLYSYIQSGELKSIKVGRSRRILLDDLRTWLESRRDSA